MRRKEAQTNRLTSFGRVYFSSRFWRWGPRSERFHALKVKGRESASTRSIAVAPSERLAAKRVRAALEAMAAEICQAIINSPFSRRALVSEFATKAS